MSRSDRLISRIEEALRGVKVETSEIYCLDVRESPFGVVNLVTFLWRLDEDDASADNLAREVASRLAEKNICAMFHKTRRQTGERLLTAAQALNDKNSNYSYGLLHEFARNWLIEVTQAGNTQQTPRKQSQDPDQDRQRFRM